MKNNFPTEDYSVNAIDLQQADISKEEILEIYWDYVNIIPQLKSQAQHYANLLQLGNKINSVKWRVKDPSHLIEKIIRKRKEELKKEKSNSKYLKININNYKDLVNDLIGLRAIYLFKYDWQEMNDFILQNFEVCADEEIIIYYTENDNLGYMAQEGYYNFKGKDYRIVRETKDSDYRSTHYLAIGQKPSNFKFEIQTRTIFEEAWGEIDHHIRYPNFEKHPELVRRMSILNNVISGCVELVNSDYDFFNELNKELLETKENVLNDENLIKEKQVEGNYDKSDSKESNLIQTNHINLIDRIQQLSEYNDILQSARPVMDIASYKAKNDLLNTRFAEIYNTLPEQNRVALSNANLIQNAIPSDILSTFQKAYSAQSLAIESMRNSELIKSFASATNYFKNSINNNSSAFTEAMKAQKQRDDLMKSVTLNYSEYANPINSLYKLPNLTDDKDED